MDKKVKNFIDTIGQTMVNLAERWLDECKYEDIKEYQKVLQKTADKFGLTLTGMTKKPFGCTLTEGGVTYTIQCKFRGNSAKVVAYCEPPLAS